MTNTVPDADRITSRNLKAEAKRAYAAPAEQHRVYEEQAVSVGADQCRAAHGAIADGYDALGIALIERARYFGKEGGRIRRSRMSERSTLPDAVETILLDLEERVDSIRNLQPSERYELLQALKTAAQAVKPVSTSGDQVEGKATADEDPDC